MQGLGRFFWITMTAFLAAWVTETTQAALDLFGVLKAPIESDSPKPARQLSPI
jgi:hypothetical protein